MKVYIAVIDTESGEHYYVPFEHSPSKKEVKEEFKKIGAESWNDVYNYDVFEEETVK